jgi:hypothetical protein|tara:strand:+ start:20457 stop:20603 length:147 start_codon:yes stop_codon:yes gene_type:complete
MYNWYAMIRTKWGDVKVEISAPNQHIAKSLLESQYGAGSIIGGSVNLL